VATTAVADEAADGVQAFAEGVLLGGYRFALKSDQPSNGPLVLADALARRSRWSRTGSSTWPRSPAPREWPWARPTLRSTRPTTRWRKR